MNSKNYVQLKFVKSKTFARGILERFFGLFELFIRR